MRRAIYNLITLACVASAFWAWKAQGVQGAGNLIAGLCCLYGLAGTLLALAPMTDRDKAVKLSHGAARAIANITNATLVVSLVWYGHFWLASMIVVGCAGAALYREQVAAIQAGA